MEYVLAKIIVIFIILLTILSVMYNRKSDKLCTLPVMQMNDAENTLITGDIVFARYDYIESEGWYAFSQYFLKNIVYSLVTSIYTHVGIIIKNQDQMYVYTAMDSIHYDNVTQTYKKGSMLLPFREYAMMYPGQVAICRLVTPLDNMHDLHNVLIDHQQTSFDSDLLRLINTVIDITITPLYDDRLTCAQLVGDILKGLNLISSVHTPNLSVGDIMDFAKDSGKYLSPILLRNPYAETVCF